MTILAFGAWIYPVAMVAVFYCTWFTAWIVLDRRPIPSLDDPTQISPVVDVVYFVSGLLLVGFPIAVAGGLGTFALNDVFAMRGYRRTFFKALVFLVLWAAALTLLRWDPLLVGAWYMD